MVHRRIALALFALLVLWVKPAVSQALPVDLELVLAVDASGSVDEAEFQLQVQGIAAAFRDPVVIQTIERQPLKRIAVALAIWSESNRPKDLSPWIMVSDAASAEAFAQLVEGFPRRIANGGTGIGKAIHFATQAMLSNEFAGSRRVVDISGDGRETAPQDWTLSPQDARLFADAHGVTVNGLAILSDDAGLADYYRQEIIVGAGAFVLEASGYDSFAAAIRAKLLREIDQRPQVSAR